MIEEIKECPKCKNITPLQSAAIDKMDKLFKGYFSTWIIDLYKMGLDIETIYHQLPNSPGPGEIANTVINHLEGAK